MGGLPIHHPTLPRPEALNHVAADRVVTLDVRDELRAGREPFSLIMDAVRAVPPGGALALRAIFEPVPLYEVLGRRGFQHWTERHSDDDWTVWFYPAPADEAVEADAGEEGLANVDVGGDVVVLDVRGLEPPEPMMKTLAALEALPAGAVLVQLNARPPQFLLPILEERGFTYEIRQQEPDLVRIFIRRTGEA